VLDIFAIPTDIARSANPGVFEGIVHFNGVPVELLSAFQFFDGNHNEHLGPVCFLDGSNEDAWTTRILQPLLTASGYRVTFDEAEREHAAVILSPMGALGVEGEAKTILLRDTVHPTELNSASIYRYDRVALIDAIEAKIAGAR
jgi:two-component system, chemotaxis family, sensor kinase CheA